MTIGLLLFLILGLAGTGFVIGRQRAIASVRGDTRKLHSLPSYAGYAVALFTSVPALLLVLLWLFVQPLVIQNRVSALILPENIADGSTLDLVMSDVRRVAEGIDQMLASGMAEDELSALVLDPAALSAAMQAAGIAFAAEISTPVAQAAVIFRADLSLGRNLMGLAAVLLAITGFFTCARRIDPAFRARNVVEHFIVGLLIAASSVAVLTTIGIILSLVFESWHFLQIYPARDFFLSLTWNPQFGGGSELGLWPLLWGTLYVSFIALAVAVPIGLMAAIYLSEYAGGAVRSVAKPAIEVLAGIPSIVYGLFALMTVGPFLRDWFAQPLGLGESSSSVMTAGLVMGIMLIPYVSSLSDDIINAVPQSLRDGSYGLGATQSETIRQVVFPAALPGIVGAILMAASRAIGETMIVVLGAGAAAKLDLNPFEAMTTVTVKIVSQLTGDTEFASPETLVAFALGLTLFVFTLGLNILALYIVRKYREQYE